MYNDRDFSPRNFDYVNGRFEPLVDGRRSSGKSGVASGGGAAWVQSSPVITDYTTGILSDGIVGIKIDPVPKSPPTRSKFVKENPSRQISIFSNKPSSELYRTSLPASPRPSTPTRKSTEKLYRPHNYSSNIQKAIQLANLDSQPERRYSLPLTKPDLRTQVERRNAISATTRLEARTLLAERQNLSPKRAESDRNHQRPIRGKSPEVSASQGDAKTKSVRPKSTVRRQAEDRRNTNMESDSDSGESVDSVAPLQRIQSSYRAFSDSKALQANPQSTKTATNTSLPVKKVAVKTKRKPVAKRGSVDKLHLSMSNHRIPTMNLGYNSPSPLVPMLTGPSEPGYNSPGRSITSRKSNAGSDITARTGLTIKSAIATRPVVKEKAVPTTSDGAVVKIRKFPPASKARPTPRAKAEPKKLTLQDLINESGRVAVESLLDTGGFFTDLVQQKNNTNRKPGTSSCSSLSSVGIHNCLKASLFPCVPPTIRFFKIGTGADVEKLPIEVLRLLKWRYTTVTPVVLRRILYTSGIRITERSNNWIGVWGKQFFAMDYKLMRGCQKANHFPGTYQAGRKDLMWRNLVMMQTRFGKKEFDFMPQTFLLPQDNRQLLHEWETCGSKQRWIVKPPAAARGHGVFVVHKYTQIPRGRAVVVQKYISNPYLINQTKFDLRIYVYITCFDPMRIYVYRDGLVRFASIKYNNSTKSLSERFIHLTNYSVQKSSSSYMVNHDISSCEGHKWTLQALWRHLASEGVDTEAIWTRIKDIIIRTFISIEGNVNYLCKGSVSSDYTCHELFGFDILIDDTLKPWLLEVNISPSLHSTSTLDVHIKGCLLTDLMNLCGMNVPSRLSRPAEKRMGAQLGLTPPDEKSDELFLCFREDLFAKATCAEETAKHARFQRKTLDLVEALRAILCELTPDDVRHLVLYEDERERGMHTDFIKIFPTACTVSYLPFFDWPRYYTILLHAWELKCVKNRQTGLSLLRDLCSQKYHFKVNNNLCSYAKNSVLSKDAGSPPMIRKPATKPTRVKPAKTHVTRASLTPSPSVTLNPTPVSDASSDGRTIFSPVRHSPQSYPLSARSSFCSNFPGTTKVVKRVNSSGKTSTSYLVAKHYNRPASKFGSRASIASSSRTIEAPTSDCGGSDFESVDEPELMDIIYL